MNNTKLISTLLMLISIYATVVYAEVETTEIDAETPNPAYTDVSAKYTTYPAPPIPMSADLYLDLSTNWPYQGGYGIYVMPNKKVIGIYAGQEVRPDLSLKDGSILYSPTLAMGNNNPLEVTTAYWTYNGITTRLIMVWDHKKGYNVVNKPIDSNFIDTYTRIFPEGRLYFVTIMRRAGEWRTLFYNFKDGKWEKIYGTRSNEKNVTNGWDSYETQGNFNTECPSVPDIDSTNIKIYDKGGLGIDNNGNRIYTRPGWYLMSPKYGKSEQRATGLCDYIWEMKTPYHWQVYSSPEVIIPLES